MIGHPRDLDLFALSEDGLESRDAERIAAHLTSCPSCDRRVRSYRALRLAASLPMRSAIPRSERINVALAFSERRDFSFSSAISRPITRREWGSAILFSLLLGGWAGYLATNPGKAVNFQAHSSYSHPQLRYLFLTGGMSTVAMIGLILAFVFPVGQNFKSKRVSILLWSQPLLSCALSVFAMTVGDSKINAWPPWHRTAYLALWYYTPMWLSIGLLAMFLLASIGLALSREVSNKIHGFCGIFFFFLYFMIYF